MRKLTLTALLAALVLAAVAGYLYMQREQLLQRAIEHYGSAILGASVSVSSVHLSPVDGDGAVRGLRIGAPLGFSRDVATAEAIELSVDPATLTDAVVHVRRIALLRPDIVYEQGRSGTNLEALQRNVRRYIGEASAEQRPGTRFIVDRLVIRNAQLTYIPLSGVSGAAASMQLPDITLRDIGKGRGGVTAGELSRIIVDALTTRTASTVGQRVLKGTVNRLFKW